MQIVRIWASINPKLKIRKIYKNLKCRAKVNKNKHTETVKAKGGGLSKLKKQQIPEPRITGTKFNKRILSCS